MPPGRRWPYRDSREQRFGVLVSMENRHLRHIHSRLIEPFIISMFLHPALIPPPLLCCAANTPTTHAVSSAAVGEQGDGTAP